MVETRAVEYPKPFPSKWIAIVCLSLHYLRCRQCAYHFVSEYRLTAMKSTMRDSLFTMRKPLRHTIQFLALTAYSHWILILGVFNREWLR